MRGILIPRIGQDILLEAYCISHSFCRRLVGLVVVEGKEVLYCRACGLAWDRDNPANIYVVDNPDERPIIRA